MNIDHVNLSRIDLNLLVALDALLTERSVTRAATRVGLGQSAMSHNLARLRALFGDELLTRGPEGMRPTPRALALIDPVRIALAQITALARMSAACRRSSRAAPDSGTRCSRWPFARRVHLAPACAQHLAGAPRSGPGTAAPAPRRPPAAPAPP